jgi:hypothetical protein
VRRTEVPNVSSASCSTFHPEDPVSRPFRSTLSLLVIASILTSSCRGWSVQDTAPAEYLRGNQPGTVRLFKSDGKQVVLMEPEVVGDSIRGYATTTGRPSFALAEIDSLAVRKTKWGNTVLLIGGVGAAVALATLLSNCDDARGYC